MKSTSVIFICAAILLSLFPILAFAEAAFYIDGTTGNVGIGTTNPLVPLSVNGTASSTSLYISSLANPAGSFLAIDGSGRVISTTSPSSIFSSPTFQVLTNSSGIYTVSSGVTKLYIRIIGGGGGGGGGNLGNTGGNGGQTAFGNGIATTTANGGSGGIGSSGNSAGGAGGTGGTTNLGTSILRISGTGGSGGANGLGGSGGASPFGGSGQSPGNGVAVGINAASNSGSGASGSGFSQAGRNAGGGGAGEYVEFTISNPSTTYSYAVGTGGTGGSGGDGTSNGGAGANGTIVVEEFYH